MKYYIVTGEVSGDLYGARLMAEIKKIDPENHIRFWGGDNMLLKSNEIVHHIKEYSVMGLFEVLTKLNKFRKLLNTCKNDLLKFKPDALILIDFPGFNLRIASFAKKHGIKVYYYIPPKIWAWNKKRIFKIKKYIQKVYTIFPFEDKYYKQEGIKVNYYGHPATESIILWKKDPGFIESLRLKDMSLIALLPGSRHQEISSSLPLMEQLSEKFSNYNFIIAASHNIDISFYKKFIPANRSNLCLLYGKTYDILANSVAGIITSGTASLEAALLGLPHLVCYKTNPLTYYAAKSFLNIKYISPVNLILNKESVKELIQSKMTITNINQSLNDILKNSNTQNQMINDFNDLKNILRFPCSNISFSVANDIIMDIKN